MKDKKNKESKGILHFKKRKEKENIDQSLNFEPETKKDNKLTKNKKEEKIAPFKVTRESILAKQELLKKEEEMKKLAKIQKKEEQGKKEKVHFTRKNLIFLSLLVIFFLIQFFCLFCIDENSGFTKKDNPISGLSKAFGFGVFENISLSQYMAFTLNIVYLFIAIAALLFEYRIAKYYRKKPWDTRHVGYYVLTIGIYLVAAVAETILLQLPFGSDRFALSTRIMWQSFFLAFIVFAILGLIITAFLMIYVNMRNIDKPYRFFGKKSKIDEEIENLTTEKEAAKEALESDLSKSLDEVQGLGVGVSGNVSGAVAGGASSTLIDNAPALKEKDRVFPGLCLIDKLNEFEEAPIISDEVNLEEIATGFRNYLGSKKMYFDIETIRQFISALGTTRLIILEGLSGTGKSSLPRFLGDYLKCGSFFAPVQATWRDRSALLGYYNDFSKMFNETDFLKKLYEASFTPSKLNLMVLDELNLSRIEYYFADFLSILEYPSDQWKLTLMQLPYDFETPTHLQEGKLSIPTNTYFIGTANKDDSTYTITDKVYDRAITIDFDDRNEPFEIEEEVKPISVSADYLQGLFVEAKSHPEYHLSKEELSKFIRVVNFVYDTFDITFGNRILNQIEDFVPVYVACGGTKEEALDFLLTRKVIYKIEGRFEDYVKLGLMDLKELINKEYKNTFKLTLKTIDKMLKRM